MSFNKNNTHGKMERNKVENVETCVAGIPTHFCFYTLNHDISLHTEYQYKSKYIKLLTCSNPGCFPLGHSDP